MYLFQHIGSGHSSKTVKWAMKKHNPDNPNRWNPSWCRDSHFMDYNHPRGVGDEGGTMIPYRILTTSASSLRKYIEKKQNNFQTHTILSPFSENIQNTSHKRAILL